MRNLNRTVVCLVIALGGLAAVAQGAEVNCFDLVTNTCSGCHEKEKACNLLGMDKTFWKGKIGMMVANGVDLTKAEREALAECLSTPKEECSMACE